MREFLRRLYYLLNRRRMEQELQNDIEVHREMMSAENRKDFGNPSLLRERARETWGWGWLDRVFQDLRFGARLLRKSPALAFTAIGVLALGIGVNVTAFNIVDVMFFKPLPVRDPQSLVRFTAQAPTMSSTEVPYPAAMFYRNNNSVLSAVLAQTSTTMTLNGDANENVRAGLVSGNYFSELGASPAYGRLFDPKTHEAPDAAPVLVLGYRYWQNRFGGDATIVGRTIRLNQRPATVIGVTSFDFAGLDPEHGQEDEIWLMISTLSYFVPDTKLLTSFDFTDSGVRMSGRLKPGITRRAAAAALRPLSQELVRQHLDTLPKGLELVARPGGYAVNLDPADSMFPLFGLIASLVLLILAAACGNLGNLLLGHAVNREREISIRLALGATRRRIVRQLMTESLLLAVLGAAAGLLLSWYVSRTLVVALGGTENLNVSPDWRTFLFAMGVGTLACVLFGLPPARQASRQAHRKSRARTIFMATQVAASCVLLVVGALLVRALHNALTADPGFDYKQVVTIDPHLYEHGYTPTKAKQYMDELRARMPQVPGVKSTALTTHPPLGTRVTLHPTPSGPIYISQTTPAYFKTMAIPLLRGRDFLENEQDVTIVSDSCARKMWPGKDPVQQVYTEYAGKKLRVIGVSGNARTVGLRDGTSSEMYVPVEEKNVSEGVILVRVSGPPEQLVPLLLGIARNIDPALSPKVAPLRDAYQDKVGDTEKLTAVVSGMGLLALLLAVVGLYGVVSYHVAQNTREIGIRIALGAPPTRVVQSMVSRFFLPLAFALSLGIALAAGLSLVLRRELYGISNFDPLSYLAAIALLAGVGGMAALIPARRALKVDPMVALRCE